MTRPSSSGCAPIPGTALPTSTTRPSRSSISPSSITSGTPALPSTASDPPAVAKQSRLADARSADILARMPHKPEITVAAVTEDDGRFLVVEERINDKLVLNQPAGHVEHGETLLEAVIREAREETAWHFEPRALLGAYLWRNPRNGRHTLRFAFTGTVSDHKPEQPLDSPV